MLVKNINRIVFNIIEYCKVERLCRDSDVVLKLFDAKHVNTRHIDRPSSSTRQACVKWNENDAPPVEPATASRALI